MRVNARSAHRAVALDVDGVSRGLGGLRFVTARHDRVDPVGLGVRP